MVIGLLGGLRVTTGAYNGIRLRPLDNAAYVTCLPLLCQGSNWSYVTRTTPSISHLLQPMEDVIREKFVPTLTDRPPPNDVERHLFSLPARLGGLAIPNPCDTSDNNYNASLKISNPLKHAILTYQFWKG